MTPKAQQIGNFDLPNKASESKLDENHNYHQRSPSSSSDIIATVQENRMRSSTNSLSALLLYSLPSRVTSVISPTVIFLVATPIAIQYPMLQLMMFLAIIVGSSPLYFIMITFVGKSAKHDTYQKNNQPQPHRRQPSIVGSIADLK